MLKRSELVRQEASRIFGAPAEVVVMVVEGGVRFQLLVYKPYIRNLARGNSPEACLQQLRERNGV